MQEVWTDPPDSSVLTEWNLANSWQRRSSLSSRTPQRSTPMTRPPMGSSTSSRRTLPESNCPPIRSEPKLSEHLHRRHLAVQIKTTTVHLMRVSRHYRSDVMRRKAWKDIYRLSVYISDPIKCVCKIHSSVFLFVSHRVLSCAHSGDVLMGDWRHFLEECEQHVSVSWMEACTGVYSIVTREKWQLLDVWVGGWMVYWRQCATRWDKCASFFSWTPQQALILHTNPQIPWHHPFKNN